MTASSSRFFSHDAQTLGDEIGMALGQGVQRRNIEVVQGALNGFGHALDIDAPARKFGCQTRILALAADSQRQLIIGYEHDRSLPVNRVIIEVDAGDPRGA